MYPLVLLLILLSPVIGQAQVTVGSAVSAESSPAASTTVTYNHTIEVDATGIVVALCERDTNASNFTAGSSTVTVGGVSATQVTAVQTSDNIIRIPMFYLASPSIGTQSIVANSDTGSDRMIVGSMTVKGAALSSPLNTALTASNIGSANADISGLASNANELAVLVGCVRTSTVTPSPDATAPVSTEQLDVAHTDATSVRIFIYTESGASPTVDMLVDLSASERWSADAVSIMPPVASGTSIRRRAQ